MKPVQGVTEQLNILLHNLLNQRLCISSGFPGALPAYHSAEKSRGSARAQAQGHHGYHHLPNKAAQARLQAEIGDQCCNCKCNQKFPKAQDFTDVLFKTKQIHLRFLSAQFYHSVAHSSNGSHSKKAQLFLKPSPSQCTKVKALMSAQHAALTLSTSAADDTPAQSGNKDSDGESEEQLDPSLEVMASSTSASSLKTMKVMPGKGPPPEPPVNCCMSGCANCVWIVYAEELKNYYNDGGEAAREALEKIENPSLKAFLKLELGL